MAINLFKVKKWGALMFPGLLGSICFIVAIRYNFLIGIIFLMIGIILGAAIGNLLLRNPFTAMLEGKGLLAFNIDSTGLIQPFIVNVLSPYITGKIKGKQVNDVFNREAVYSLAPPVTAKNKAIIEKGTITYKLTENDLNNARFGLWHYPVLIYNSQIKSFVTKGFLSDTEKENFAEHGVLYLNRKMEELTSAVRDFGRHVVELTKPTTSIFKSKWFMIVLIIGLVILLIIFAPAIFNTVKSFSGNAGGVGGLFGGAAGQAITPLN